MPEPIVRVPIDDAPFQKFLKLFAKYRQDVTDSAGDWEDITDAIRGGAEASDDAAASIDKQSEATRRLSEAEERRDKNREKADRDREKAADREAKRLKEEHEARKKQLDQVHEYTRSVTGMVESFGKWSAGGAAGGVGKAISGFGAGLGGEGGIGRLAGMLLGGLGGAVAGVGLAVEAGGAAAGVVADKGRSARGYGVGYSKLQAYETNLQQFVDVDGVLGNLSAAQNDPRQWSPFSALGIKNPRGMGVDQLFEQVLRRSKGLYQKNPILAQNVLGPLGIDPGALRRLSDPHASLDTAIKGADDWAKKNKVSDDTVQKMTNLSNAVDLLNKQVENFATNAMAPLADKTMGVVKGFGDMIDDLKVIVPWLDKWAKIISPSAIAHEVKDLGTIHTSGGVKVKDTPFGKALGFVGGVGQSIYDSVFGKGGHSIADRNNNPGNIMRNGQYRHFATMQAGFDAMAHQVQIDYNKHGSHTIAALINGSDHPWSSEYAPGNSHASAMNYIAHVSGALGVRGDQQINLNDPKVLATVARAMYEFESGHRSQGGSGGARPTTSPTPRHVHHYHHHKIENKTGASVTVQSNAMGGG